VACRIHLLLLALGACGRSGFDDHDANVGDAGDAAAGSHCIAQLEVGEEFGCTLLQDHTALCWGANLSGELGDGSFVDRPVAGPVLAAAGTTLTGIMQLSTGPGSVACALRDDATAWCWGDNRFGQLGDGTTNNQPYPVQVMASPGVPLTGLTGVYAGETMSCAIAADRTVWCWGSNSYGQLGNGVVDAGSPYPVHVLTPGSGTLVGPIGMAIAVSSACVWDAVGNLACWGSNGVYEAGSCASTQPVLYATAVAMPPVSMAATEGGCVCAVSTSGGVQCFGGNARGQLGDQTMVVQGECPAVMALDNSGAPLQNVVEVATGDDHTCARQSSGTVLCWGDDDSGQIGNGSFASAVLVAAPVTLPAVATQLRLGNNHSCAVLADHTVWCWGLDNHGQLGNGTNVANSAVPVQVMNLPGC
jgi:alpha-tubulin suppressor-like RCC1 family protein